MDSCLDKRVLPTWTSHQRENVYGINLNFSEAFNSASHCLLVKKKWLPKCEQIFDLGISVNSALTP